MYTYMYVCTHTPVGNVKPTATFLLLNQIIYLTEGCYIYKSSSVLS